MLELLSWVAMAMSIIGTLFNSTGKRAGFYFWIVSNFYWIYYNFTHKAHAQGFLFLFFLFANFYAIRAWKKKGIQ